MTQSTIITDDKINKLNGNWYLEGTVYKRSDGSELEGTDYAIEEFENTYEVRFTGSTIFFQSWEEVVNFCN